MRQAKLEFYIRKYLNMLFYLSFFVIFLWIVQATHAIVTNGFFSAIRVYVVITTISMHSLTALVICGFYLYNFLKLNYRPIPVRITFSATLVVVGILFYDFVWIVCDYLVAGSGNPLIQLSLFVLGLSALLLYNIYHKKMQLLCLNKTFFLILGFFLFIMYIMVASGFYATYHSGVDPHNWIWFAGKFSAICAWSSLLQ